MKGLALAFLFFLLAGCGEDKCDGAWISWHSYGPFVAVDGEHKCSVSMTGGWSSMEKRGWIYSKGRGVCYRGSSYGTFVSTYEDTEGLRLKDEALAASPCKRKDLASWALAWCGWSIDMQYCSKAE